MLNSLFITWNVDPTFLDEPIRLGYYNILFVGSLVLCIIILRKFFLQDGNNEITYFKLVLFSIIGIVIGARLGHCLFYDPMYYFQHPLEMILPFRFDNGTFRFIGYQGLASHGGTIGLIIAIVIYCRNTKQNIVRTFDYIALVTPLAAGCIRLGNLMNSEIIGCPTDVPWAFIFTRVDMIPRHPAQLYEAIAYFSFFILNILIYKNYRLQLKPGIIFGLTLTLIFTFRFFIEFLKEIQSGFEAHLFLDMGQILSIPFILIGLFFLFLYKPKYKNN